MNNNLLKQIKSTIRYDKDTGLFYYTVKTLRKSIGDIAGYNWKANKDGCYYKKIFFKGKEYALHRLAFAFMGESIPDIVDHIDGVGINNEWANLRAATKSLNARNSNYKSTPVSGYFGVYPLKNTGRYEAKARLNGKNIYIGSFKTAVAAFKARKEFDVNNGSTKRHGETK